MGTFASNPQHQQFDRIDPLAPLSNVGKKLSFSIYEQVPQPLQMSYCCASTKEGTSIINA